MLFIWNASVQGFFFLFKTGKLLVYMIKLWKCPLVQCVSDSEGRSVSKARSRKMMSQLMWKPATWAGLDPGSELKRCDSSSAESGKCHLTLTYWLQWQQRRCTFLIWLPVQVLHIFMILAWRGTGREARTAPGCLQGLRQTPGQWGTQKRSGLKNRQSISHLGSCTGRPEADRPT